MSLLPEQCHHDRCREARGRLSVFCDEHHVEQLERIGLSTRLISPAPIDDILRRQCKKLLTAFDLNAINSDELYSNLFDDLVHAGTEGFMDHWGAYLDQLPAPIVTGLATFLHDHPEPRTFLPNREPAFQTKALKVQTALVDMVMRKLNTSH